MSTNKNIEPVLVFAGTNWEVGIVKSLLENAEVEAFLKDDLMGTINPWVTEAGGAGAVKVYISSIDVEKAIPIVKEFQENLKEDKKS